MREKKRRSLFDVFDEMDDLMKDLKSSTGSGYSMSVTYDEYGRPIVNVETYGDVDKDSLRREIEKQYPGAKITGLEKEPLIEEINEEEGEN